MRAKWPQPALRVWRAVACGLTLMMLAGCADRETPGQQEEQAPPPAVTVAVVDVQEVSESFEFVGRMEARQAVDVRARVQGFLEQRQFAEGDAVQAGELLFAIEPDQYQVRLAVDRKILTAFSPRSSHRSPPARLRRRPLPARRTGSAPSARRQHAAAARSKAWRGNARSEQAAQDAFG